MIITPKMAASYTILIQGTSVPITARPRKASKRSLIRTIIDLPTKSDAHRKVIGHILLILGGLIAAAIEIMLNFAPIYLTVTQVILPAVVQEAYDFKWKL
jgi:hypothetical protein